MSVISDALLRMAAIDAERPHRCHLKKTCAEARAYLGDTSASWFIAYVERWLHQRDERLAERDRPSVIAARSIPCESCPLRPLDVFRTFETERTGLRQQLQEGRTRRRQGRDRSRRGQPQRASLHGAVRAGLSATSCWPTAAGRSSTTLLPGDLIGLQGSLMGEMQHSVEALSPMLLCVFEREQLHDALPQPSRALPSTSPGSPRARSRCWTRTCSASAGARRSSAPPI